MNENCFTNHTDIIKPKKVEDVLRNPDKVTALRACLKNTFDNRPVMSNFLGAMAGTKWANEYSEESIIKDMQYAALRLSQMEEANSDKGQAMLDKLEDNYEFSELGQAMIADRMNSWMPDFVTIMTASVDDIGPGIDTVTSKNGSHFGTAFDVTVSSNTSKIDDKLKKNWDNNISRGQLSTVKYFQNPDTKEKSRLTVPKFIVGASARDVNEMAQAYLDGNEESLNKHPLRKLILDQIEVQLDGVLTFYEDNPDSRFEFAKQRYQEVEKNIKEAKQKLNESEIMDRVECHAHAKESLALTLINDFFNQKKTVS